MDFTELESLRRYVAEIRRGHLPSLKDYYDQESNGFARKHQNIRLSPASTATCLLSLAATGLYQSKDCDDWRQNAPKLTQALVRSEWQSAHLKKTAFTVAFVLEAVTVLCDDLGVKLEPADQAKVSRAESLLRRSVNNPKHRGSVAIREYPPTAYVTQLVTRVLERRKVLPADLRIQIRTWAAREITRQIALFARVEKTADCYALAYSAILLASLSHPSGPGANTAQQLSPEEVALLQAAIDLLFAKQLPDGSWPSSQPLFHYPREGNAYCYEYEMLVQLLGEWTLHPLLLKYLDKLARAAYALKDRAFLLPSGALAWASGHHPQDPGPESWATASVFHFVHALNRLVTEGVRRELFRYVNQEYHPPLEPRRDYPKFAPKFLDSNVMVPEQSPRSLRQVLLDFVTPIAESALDVTLGHPFPDKVKISAIFYGPPGTSKTKLTKYIADFLRWPRLVIDPSHLVRKGMDLIQAEANTLFEMIAAAERIVVLFDEFDEIVRERTSANSEMISRLLTTAMLPKLSQIYERRRIVFILATNHIEQFDFTISRLGRFDRIIQIMPPTAKAKLESEEWRDAIEHLKKIGTTIADLEKHLDVLTYKEFEEMVPRLMGAPKPQRAAQIVEEFADKGIMRKTLSDGKTWEDKCREQQVHNRV